MADVTVKRVVNAPVADVWASWDNFGDIYKFNPNLKSSRLLSGSNDTGRGARRQCDMADGKNHILERIIGYTPEKEMVIDIYDGTLPLKSAKATLRFVSTTNNRTEVSMRMDFVPKMGLLGKMMIPMMKPQFRKMLQGLVDANAAFVERGEEVSLAA